jgi:hypothetical protein
MGEVSFNFKLKGGTSYRFSFDAEAGKHIEAKTDAEALADGWRTAIRAGTIRRRDETTATVPATTTADALTLEQFAEQFVERVSKIRERNKSWKNDEYNFAQIAAFTFTDGSRLGDKALGAITEDDLEAFMASLRAKGHAASTLHHVQETLRHSSIEQTSTYLNVVAAGLQASMAKNDAARCNPVASNTEIELQLSRNETADSMEKPTVN